MTTSDQSYTMAGAILILSILSIGKMRIARKTDSCNAIFEAIYRFFSANRRKCCDAYNKMFILRIAVMAEYQMRPNRRSPEGMKRE